MMDGMPEDASVKMARNRFKNVLRHMSLQDSYMQDDESDSDTDEGRNRLMRYPSMKKRRKSDSADAPKPQTSFVMKLFDRGVDLAQFDDATPLYPICRAWMQNKPHNPRGSNRTEDEKEEEQQEIEVQHPESPDVTRLPPPEPLPCDEYGNLISVRIPPPLARENEPFVINYDDDMAPSPAVLFQNHLDRWNLIRQRWREASAYNERRYESSFSILRQIHDRVNIITTTQMDIPTPRIQPGILRRKNNR